MRKENKYIQSRRNYTCRMWCCIVLIMSLLVIAFLCGCGAGSRARSTSNLGEFLYPKMDGTVEKESPSALPMPFKIGIAFVPDSSSTVNDSPTTTKAGVRNTLMLSEKQKTDLMGKILKVIQTYPFIKSIESIPSQYLVSKGGFTNLDQIRSLYGIDVIILLSYDQVQHTDEGLSSIMYWTILGAYMVEGEKNDTNTMIDAAAFYIPSRKMIFRCAGTSHVKAKSTPINLSEQLRIDSYDGFEKAVDSLTANLRGQLDQLPKKSEKSP